LIDIYAINTYSGYVWFLDCG